MATKKVKKGAKGVSLSNHIEKVTTAIHSGVANALKPSTAGGDPPSLMYDDLGLGKHVNPKTVIVTVTFVIDLT
jgi:hypothetical protein